MNTDNQENLHVLSESDDYTLITNGMYDIYDEYEDANFCIIDDDRSIHMNDSHIVITEELNSQYIPFKTKRFWDGIDLTKMLIRINFINSNYELGASKVINVKYNSEYIIFHWLIDRDLSCVYGEIKFEILAIGKNIQGDHYLWRTKPDGKINIIKGLDYNGVIEPTPDWYIDFQQTMTNLVMQAKNYSEIAESYVIEINNTKTSLENNLNLKITELENSIMNLHTELENVESDILELKNRPLNIYDINFTEDGKLQWIKNNEIVKEFIIQT